MRVKVLWVFAAILMFCGTMNVRAQVMKASDLEKYAKEKYGDKWLDAAANLARNLTLDKNESLTYQEVIEAPSKTKQQLYVALNYWATATSRISRLSPSTIRRRDALSSLRPYRRLWSISALSASTLSALLPS